MCSESTGKDTGAGDDINVRSRPRFLLLRPLHEVGQDRSTDAHMAK